MDPLMAFLAVMSIFGQIAERENPKNNRTTQTTETPPWTPRDPGYAMLSPAMLGILSEGWGQMGGAGMPGGAGPGMSFTGDILEHLKKAWPKIMEEQGKPKAPGPEEHWKQFTRGRNQPPPKGK